MNQPAQHVACDGCGIARDDLKELETLRRRDEIRQELFRNAARVRKAVRSNAWLRPVFRKYKEVCREIIHQKNQEAAHFATLCEYCDTNDNNNNDMKRIREELEQIHAQIAAMGGNDDDGDGDGDDDSTSSSDMSADSDNEGNEVNEDNEGEDNEGNEDNDSVSSSSSSSSSSLKKRMEDFV